MMATIFRLLVFGAAWSGFAFIGEAQQPQPQPTAAAEEKVTLQLPNNPVGDLLTYYERLTGKRLIKDANLTGPSLSVVAPEPMPKSEAIRFIEAALLLNGYSLIPAGDNAIKVLNTNAGKLPRSEAPPLYANATALPKGEQVVSYFMPLRYVTSADALNIFQQHIKVHSYGVLVSVPSTQALLITENASVIRHLVSLQELIDVPPAKVLSEFVTLERADAERVAELINKLLDSRKNQSPGAPAAPGGGANTPAPAAGSSAAGSGSEGTLYERNLVSGDVQLVPDPRTNRILVVTRPINFDYIKKLIKEFDLATNLTQPLEVPLKFVMASEVLPVLQNMLSEGKETGAGGTPSATRTTAAPAAAAAAGSSSLTRPDRLTGPTEDTSPESLIVGKTRLIADKKTNSILVLGPPESVDKVRTILERLDKRPRQVYLSTVIGQLTLGDNLEFGVDILQKFSRLAGGADKSSRPGIATGIRNRSGAADLVPNPRSLSINSAFPLPAGLTIYGTFGSTLDIFVKALESSNRFKVIARPTVYTANNKKAVISSGQKIAVPTSTLSSLNTGTTNNTAVTATIDYKDVVLKLEVLPLINTDKEVTLQIAQQDDTIVGSQTIGGNTVPTIGTQEINTTITVPNRSTVVLGGLITETKSTNTSGVPFLGKIPLLGYFFRDTTKSTQRAELMILIEPTVIETEAEMAEAERKEKNRVEVGADTYQMTKPPVDKKSKRKDAGEAKSPPESADDSKKQPP